MFIRDLYDKEKTVLSLEVFPPKKDGSVESLVNVLEAMASTKPSFVSVTYGASGNQETTKYSQTIASMLKNQYDTETLFHLTCVNTEPDEIVQILDRLKKLNIKNILALRGDIPKIDKHTEKQYPHAIDLIKKINAYGGFSIGATCYPEGHIDELNYENNFAYLKEKQENGADFFISQLFFDNRHFLNFKEQAIKKSITKPLIAGIMPILSKSQVDRMIYMCGVSLPSAIVRILHQYTSNDDIKKAGIEYALNQAEDLIKEGVDGIHLYTMNQEDIAKQGMLRLKALTNYEY